MAGTEGARRPLAMHVQVARAAVDDMGFRLAGIVRDVEQKIEPRLREEPPHRLAGEVAEDFTIGESAIDGGAHRAEIALAELGPDRRAGEIAVGQIDAEVAGRDRHLLEEFAADLVAEAARAAMNRHHYVVWRKPERIGRGAIENLGHDLHFEVVIARAERAHFAALPVLRALGDAVRTGAFHRPAFLDPGEVGRLPEPALDRPGGAAREHPVRLDGVERDRPFAADPRRDVARELVREVFLHGRQVAHGEPGEHRAHAAGNVEADAARRNDPALAGIECRHPANGEAVAPMRVRHRIGRLHDAGEPRDIGRLLVDLVVHRADEVLIRKDDGRHAHAGDRLDPPCGRIKPGEPSRIHDRSGGQTSTMHPADQWPLASRATRSSVMVAAFGSQAGA